MKTIKRHYKGYESKNDVSSKHESLEEARKMLKPDLASITRNGGEIIESNEDSFTFINNDHSNTEVTYYID